MDKSDRKQQVFVADLGDKGSPQSNLGDRDSAQSEFEHTLKKRAQKHNQNVTSSLIDGLIWQTNVSRWSSIVLCLLILVLISGAIWLIASGKVTASPGLGFTLGIISSVLAVHFGRLLKKIWDFDDLHKVLIQSSDQNTSS